MPPRPRASLPALALLALLASAGCDREVAGDHAPSVAPSAKPRVEVTILFTSDGEIFTLADATKILAFARQKQMGPLSFWSIHRDRPGTDYNESSTVNTADFQFAHVFKAVQ